MVSLTEIMGNIVHILKNRCAPDNNFEISVDPSRYGESHNKYGADLVLKHIERNIRLGFTGAAIECILASASSIFDSRVNHLLNY